VIIGSGLIASAFSPIFSQRQDVCIYAAGVSNSRCTDIREFQREQNCLINALKSTKLSDVFVYFGTCSVGDTEAWDSPYVQHKLKMEQLVSSSHHPYLILRLPQVASKSPNPHTLLNFLYTHISRGENFCLWRNAKRNIIDIDDITTISQHLIEDTSNRNCIVNIANPVNYSVPEIVHLMECVIGKPGKYDVLERGTDYHIDVQAITPLFEKLGINWEDSLNKVINKYFGNDATQLSRNSLDDYRITEAPPFAVHGKTNARFCIGLSK
jgi:nucleoside-diphosphate-sugar epimerase